MNTFPTFTNIDTLANNTNATIPLNTGTFYMSYIDVGIVNFDSLLNGTMNLTIGYYTSFGIIAQKSLAILMVSLALIN